MPRRGESVVVIVPLGDVEKHTHKKVGFYAAVMALRQAHHLDEHGIEPEEWLPPRDPSPGRDVNL
jgi:hypothetical protein